MFLSTANRCRYLPRGWSLWLGSLHQRCSHPAVGPFESATARVCISGSLLHPHSFWHEHLSTVRPLDLHFLISSIRWGDSVFFPYFSCWISPQTLRDVKMKYRRFCISCKLCLWHWNLPRMGVLAGQGPSLFWACPGPIVPAWHRLSDLICLWNTVGALW